MTVLLFFLGVFGVAFGEVKSGEAALEESVSAPAEVQTVAGQFSQFYGCADKVWPKSLLKDSAFVLLAADRASAWRWTAKGLERISSSSELAKVVSNVGGRTYSVRSDVKPPEIILNLGAQKPGGPPPPKSKNRGELGHQAEPTSYMSVLRDAERSVKSGRVSGSACAQATTIMKQVNQGLYRPPQASTVEAAFRLGVHENLHVRDQTELWKTNLGSDSEGMDRINDYPTNAEPRQMRYKVKIALREALKENQVPARRQQLLQEAAYWHKEYKRLYGNKESHAGPDVFEGSARYVDIVAGKVNCEKPLDATSLATLSRDAVLEGVGEGPEPTADTEAYSLGALAGSLLDQQRALDWKSKTMNQGLSALDQLLGPIAPAKGALKDKEKLDTIAGSMPKVADECFVKPDFDYLANYKDTKKYAWVSIPTTGYSGKGSYNGKSVLPNSKYVNIGASAHHGSLSATNMPLVVSADNPCGGTQSMMVLVEVSSISGGTVAFDRGGQPPSKVSGAIQPKPTAVSSLGNVYCGQ